MNIEVISPFPLEALPRVWGWISTFRNRVADDYGPKDLGEFIDKSMSEIPSMTTWAVYRDGELGGMVTFQKWSPILGTCHCLFKKEMWGRKTTFPALEQIARQLFATGIKKISMCVFSDNKAIIALLKDLGGVTEGRYRQHTLRNGELVDMTTIALFEEGFKNVISSSSSRNRRGQLDHRGSPRGKAEDDHEHDHAAVVAGDAGAPVSIERICAGGDDGPVCRAGAD